MQNFESMTFGAEFEFQASRYDVADALERGGIYAVTADYSGSRYDVWQAKSDSSCGAEAVTPILRGSEGLAEALRGLRILRESGLYVSPDCGLHVHVGVNGLTMRQRINVAKLYARNEIAMQHFARNANHSYALSNVERGGGYAYDRQNRHQDKIDRLFRRLNTESIPEARTLNSIMGGRAALNVGVSKETFEFRNQDATTDEYFRSGVD